MITNERNVKTGYEFYRSIGSPQFVVAPMVEHSELPYRMLCRNYGAQLVYTQMFHAKVFLTDAHYRKINFVTCPEDRPLIAQFCGDDPQTILAAAQLIEHQVDAIDLNLGCPQGIARRGHYGSFLLTETQLLYDIVHLLSTNLSVPVTCKIRKLPTWEQTLEVCETLVRAGCSLLTVHGRTKEEKGSHCTECDWETIRRIKEHFNGVIPIIANGGIENNRDIDEAMRITGADGVMASEAVLENPALFSNNIDPRTGVAKTMLDLAEEYIQFVRRYNPRNFNVVRSHMFKYLYRYGEVYPESREMIAMCKTEDQLQEVVDFFRERVHDHEMFEAYKWYRRYRKAETHARVAPPPTDSEVVEESPELIDDGFMSEMFDDSVYTKAAENGETIPVCY